MDAINYVAGRWTNFSRRFQDFSERYSQSSTLQSHDRFVEIRSNRKSKRTPLERKASWNKESTSQQPP